MFLTGHRKNLCSTNYYEQLFSPRKNQNLTSQSVLRTLRHVKAKFDCTPSDYVNQPSSVPKHTYQFMVLCYWGYWLFQAVVPLDQLHYGTAVVLSRNDMICNFVVICTDQFNMWCVCDLNTRDYMYIFQYLKYQKHGGAPADQRWKLCQSIEILESCFTGNKVDTACVKLLNVFIAL